MKMINQSTIKRICILCAFVLVVSVCRAQAVIDSTRSFMFITDQDFFYPPKNEDRNYTMGVSIGVTGPCWDKDSRVFPWLRKQADRVFFLNRIHKNSKGVRYITGMQLFDGAFTPRDIGTSNVVNNDRPFGNIFGVLQSRTTTYITGNATDENVSLTTRFGVGVLGLRIAESVQSWIHKNITPARDIPKGWPNQISDGGEPTLLYQVQYNQLIKEIAKEVPRNGEPWVERYLQLTWMAEGNAGWYTNVAGGLGLRIGRFYTPFYRMTSSGMNNANISQAPRKIKNSHMPFEFNVFANVRVRAVGYNALLQGQFRNSVYTLNASQLKRGIFELETGAFMRIRKFSLMFQPIIIRTPETTLPEKRIHYWGALYFAIGR